jgi:hypothetical protein
MNRTEFEQFVDKSISAGDFKLFMAYVFDKHKADDKHYENIINLFFSILQRTNRTAYDDIFVNNNQSYQAQVKGALRNILEGVYSDFMGSVKIQPDGVITKNWIDEEVSFHRPRITKNNFEKVLQAKVYENTLAHLKDLPTFGPKPQVTRFLSR